MSEVNAGIRQFGIDESQGTIELDRRPFRLSWTHYLTLMRIEDHVERDFYEREAIDNNWDAKTLRRQYGSSLYERLLLSRDKDDVMRLANESATPQKPEDLLKAPYVLEFVGLEDKASYHESDLEQAVLDHLQDFLLEMGKGFLFEKRQKRFSFADRDYFLDMVLYNRYLRCYVLVDFKAGFASARGPWPDADVRELLRPLCSPARRGTNGGHPALQTQRPSPCGADASRGRTDIRTRVQALPARQAAPAKEARAVVGRG
jgi:predicted nuclease of restriction endonuclease-like (RecB) superfamily